MRQNPARNVINVQKRERRVIFNEPNICLLLNIIPRTKESGNIMEVEMKTVIDSKFEIHVTERLIGVFVSHSADVLFVLQKSSDGP
jgi:hypothetical protein